MADQPQGRKPLPYWGFGVVVIVYLAIIQGGGLLVERVGDHDDTATTTEGVIYNLWIPLGAALVFTYAVVAVLGWWRPVLRDDRPVRRWVWVVPIVFALCSLAAIDYAALGDKTAGYVLALFMATSSSAGARKACSAASASPRSGRTA